MPKQDTPSLENKHMPLSNRSSISGPMSGTTKSMHVLYPAVKDMLSQSDCLGSRGKWVSKIQEYDFDICPKKIIWGQGFAEMMSESNNGAIREGEEEQLCATYYRA